MCFSFLRAVNFFYVQSIRVKRLSCSDSNGLNILHYALQGGNICAAQQFIEHGIIPTNDRISAIDILFMALKSKLRPPENFDCLHANHGLQIYGQHKATDIFLSQFVRSNKQLFTGGDFCKRGAKRLSIVHLLAVNAMVATLESIKLHLDSKFLF